MSEPVRYGSVCSGIEAASVAWERLGWQLAWFAQFDPLHNYNNGPDFPSAVLAWHWPDVANLGDMTKIAAGNLYRLYHPRPGVTYYAALPDNISLPSHARRLECVAGGAAEVVRSAGIQAGGTQHLRKYAGP